MNFFRNLVKIKYFTSLEKCQNIEVYDRITNVLKKWVPEWQSMLLRLGENMKMQNGSEQPYIMREKMSIHWGLGDRIANVLQKCVFEWSWWQIKTWSKKWGHALRWKWVMNSITLCVTEWSAPIMTVCLYLNNNVTNTIYS